MTSGPHPELVGCHLVLRRFDESQIHDRYLSWLNDARVNEYSQRRDGDRIERADARAYLENLDTDEVVLGIHHSEHGHVGNLKYGPIDWVDSWADISILIGETKVWGQGVGAEAVYLASRYLFEDLGLNRVEAGSNNPAFLRMVEKLGWKVEGVLRQRVRTEDGFRDHTYVALLAREFARRPWCELAAKPDHAKTVD